MFKSASSVVVIMKIFLFSFIHLVWIVSVTNAQPSMPAVVEELSASYRKEQGAPESGSYGSGLPHQTLATLPSEVRVGIRMDVGDVHLDLKQNSHVTNSAPVVMGDKERITPWKSGHREEFALYTDQNNQAAILVAADRGADGATTNVYMGMFQSGNQSYEIAPKDTGFGPIRQTSPLQILRKRRQAEGVTGNVTIEYVVRHVNASNFDYEYDTVSRMNVSEQYRAEYLRYQEYGQGGRGKQEYGVETLVVIDYAIFKRYLDRSKARDYYVRRDYAINKIRYYFSHIMNSVDLRYASMRESDFSVYIRLSGFYIAMSPASSPWTEKGTVREYDVTTRRTFTHAYRGLDALEKWLETHQLDLPFCDQASLFTGNQLFGGYSNGQRRKISGLSDIGGVCTRLRASITQDQGLYATALTAAHEMGHSLGADHDGSGNTCSRTDQYIMAPAPTQLKPHQRLNPHRFSYCSRTAFRQSMRLLTARGMNCLLNTASHVNQTEVDVHLQTPPGQRIDLDEQCQTVFGPHSYYCRGHTHDAEVCRRLSCHDPVRDLCWEGAGRRAANGTTCADRKWCLLGQCVSNPRAPAAAEYCRSGDFRGRLPGGATCERAVRISPWVCYSNSQRHLCCASCAAIRDDTSTACAYGDQLEWCKTIDSSSCYSRETRTKCCAKCREFDTGISACAFGDKASWCKTMKLGGCYNNQAICCLRCHTTGPPGCQWGDQVSWCNTLSRHQCYGSTTNSRCCSHCANRQTYIPGCEYGDRRTGCSRGDCSDRSMWRDCCYTCRQEAGLTTRTTRGPTTTTRSTTTRTPPTRRQDYPVTAVVPGHSPGGPACVDAASWCRGLHPSQCYTSRSICCATCTRSYTNTPGCEYGDQYTWCERVTTDQCRGLAFQQDCCLRCAAHHSTTTTTTTTTAPPTQPAKHTTPSSGCSDSAGWCGAGMPPSYCYSVSDTCCATCTRIWTNTPGCEYGDQYTWCEGLTEDRCQEPKIKAGCCRKCQPAVTEAPPCGGDQYLKFCGQIQQRECYFYNVTCCDSCASYYTGISGCEYGDRNTWCSGIDTSVCDRATYSQACCATCAQAQKTISATTPSTTTDDSACVDYDTQCPAIPRRDCYLPKRRDECCATCRHASAKDPACRYGDHNTWCNTHLQRPYCYYDNWKTPCCESCAKYHTGIAGCEYGDKTDGCIASLCTNPYYRPRCCYTCARDTTPLVTTVSSTQVPPYHAGCAMDSATWCKGMPARSCYADGAVCCITCALHFTGLDGCEYGDQATWCEGYIRSRDECVRQPSVLRSCCATCRKLGELGNEQELDRHQGILILVKENINKVRHTERTLTLAVTKHMNDFCTRHIGACCEAVSMANYNATGVSDILDFLAYTDTTVSKGYPIDKESSTITKVLVRVDAGRMERICHHGNRHKRAVSLYMNSMLLRDVLLQKLDNLQEDIKLGIDDVMLPPDHVTQQRALPVVGVVIAGIVCLVILVLIVTVTRLKLIKHARRHGKVQAGNLRHVAPPIERDSGYLYPLSSGMAPRRPPCLKLNNWMTDLSAKSLPDSPQLGGVTTSVYRANCHMYTSLVDPTPAPPYVMMDNNENDYGEIYGEMFEMKSSEKENYIE